MKERRTKEGLPKSTQTEARPTDATKIFENRITGAERYWLLYESPYYRKSSMSPKEWKEAFEEANSLTLEERNNKTKD